MVEESLRQRDCVEDEERVNDDGAECTKPCSVGTVAPEQHLNLLTVNITLFEEFSKTIALHNLFFLFL